MKAPFFMSKKYKLCLYFSIGTTKKGIGPTYSSKVRYLCDAIFI